MERLSHGVLSDRSAALLEGDRPVDVLVGIPRITAIRDAGRNELITWEADLRTVEGEQVCVATNTLVSRGTAAPRHQQQSNGG